MKHDHLSISGIIGGIVCTGTLLFLAVSFYQNTEALPEVMPAQETATPAWKTPVEVPVLTNNERSIKDHDALLSINIHYPSIALLQHPEFAKEGNAVLALFREEIEQNFRENAATESANGSPLLPSDLTVRWSALLLSPTLVSLRFDISEYVSGAAHPNTHVRIINYDFTNHRILSTTDLFASSTLALPFLSNTTREALARTFTDISSEQFQIEVIPGTEPTLQNFHEVGITKEGLLVVFNPYQVAAYARGIQRVLITTHEISDLISPQVKEAITLAETNIVEATPIPSGENE